VQPRLSSLVNPTHHKKKPRPAAHRPGPGRHPGWWISLWLAAGVLLVYWPVTHHDFVNYDDQDYVAGNLHVQAGLTPAGITWAFRHPVSGNWHPLTMLSHMLDCQLYGLQPGGHHLTSLLLHAGNTLLVFLLLRSLTGAVWRSALVAALFGLHPLHVESVAWVAERKDVLSTAFGLLALLAYGRYAQGLASPATGQAERRKFYWLAWGCLALGLLCKPMLVTWPGVMLLLDYWPLQRFKPGGVWPLVREKIPFLALAAGMSVVAYLVQQQDGAVAAADAMPLDARGGNALIAYCRYLAKLFWPANLAVFYPHPGYWPPARVWLAGLGLTALTVGFWRWRRRQPFLLVGWLWFVGTLVPVIGLVQVGGQAMADRYAYIPSLGIFLLVVWGTEALVRSHPVRQWVWAAASVAVIGLCLAATAQQVEYWQDSESLFRHAVEVTANNGLAHGNLGMALDKKNRVTEAISEYQEALRLRPEDVKSRDNLGIDLAKTGQWDEAIGQYEETIRRQPDFAEAHFDLGAALRHQGRMDGAIQQYEETIRLQPADPRAYNNLGNLRLSLGQTDAAIRQYEQAIQLQPTDAQPHGSLGVALLQQDRTDEAIRQFREAIRLQPDDARAHNNLGNVLLRQAQIGGAISEYQAAIRLQPDYAKAHNNLGIALEKNGQTAGAIAEFREALRCNPESTEARDNLARLSAQP